MNTLLEILNTMNTELEIKHGQTDTDKNSTHCYIDYFYENEFKKYKDKPISLLEIGINAGGSIYLWSKYFQNAKIFGLDVNGENIKEKYRNLPNVNYVIRDAYGPTSADSFENFDIIIEDGNHILESQIKAIKLFLPKLNDGGVFIIEDVQSFDFLNILKDNTPIEFHDKIEFVDLRHVKNRYDDLIFVIRK